MASALRFCPPLTRVSFADDEVESVRARFTNDRRRETSGRMGPDAQLSELVLLLRLEGSVERTSATVPAPPPSGPAPTFLSRTVLISLRKAAIFSDGTLKVGWPCRFIPDRLSVPAMIGAS